MSLHRARLPAIPFAANSEPYTTPIVLVFTAAADMSYILGRECCPSLSLTVCRTPDHTYL
jgi:hypothetical protein